MTEKTIKTASAEESADFLLSEERGALKMQNEEIKNLPLSKLATFENHPFSAEQATPSLSQAQRLKALCGEDALTEDSMLEVMREQKSNQKEQVKIPYDKVRDILKKDMPPKELEDFILKAVADYQRKLTKQAQTRDAR